MRKYLLVTTTAVIIAYGAIAANAQAPGAQTPGAQQIQPVPGGPMMEQQDQTRLQRRAQAGEDEDSDQDGYYRYRGEMMGMMGRGYGPWHRGGMGRGLMGPMMMRMIFSLMDADGDGKISLQDFIRGTSRPASQQ